MPEFERNSVFVRTASASDRLNLKRQEDCDLAGRLRLRFANESWLFALSYFLVKNSSVPLGAVIFDFDGTLLDTFPAIVAAFNAALAPISGRTYNDADVIAHFGPPDEGMIFNALQEYPDADYNAAIDRYFATFEEADKSCPIFEGITPLLDALAARQIPLGIMTGKGRRAAEITLHRLKWHARFGAIVTGDDAAPKPAPDGPLLAARELDIAPKDCVFVGDSPADMNAATAAGMAAVVAGWHGFFREDLLNLKRDFWANSPDELREWLSERGVKSLA